MSRTSQVVWTRQQWQQKGSTEAVIANQGAQNSWKHRQLENRWRTSRWERHTHTLSGLCTCAVSPQDFCVPNFTATVYRVVCTISHLYWCMTVAYTPLLSSLLIHHCCNIVSVRTNNLCRTRRPYVITRHCKKKTVNGRFGEVADQ